jgi:hypothetical protein
MQINDAWPIVAFATAAVFGAGQLVAKIRNGKYVTREICGMRTEQEHERWRQLREDIAAMREAIDRIEQKAHTHAPGPAEGGVR